MNGLEDILDKMKEKYDIKPVTPDDMQKNRVNWYNESTGNLNEFDGYNCEACRNKGYIALITPEGFEAHKECRCQVIRATLRRAQRSGLGDILSKCTFDKYEDSEDWQKLIKGKAKAFCEDDEAKWFYIGGQVGCGKTHLCTAICGHYIKAGKEVKYMLWCEESKTLKALVNDTSYTEQISDYKNVDVLYIDDFLKVQSGENPTPADIKLAFEIINHRLLDDSKITIISSEKMLEEVMEYDEATMSRIFQQAGNYKINIGRDRNRNYRLRGGVNV